MRKSPVEIAKELASKIRPIGIIKSVQATGPYVNVFINTDVVGSTLLKEILLKKEKYGSSVAGKGKTVAVEFSSPNIGKPMHFGHLRSTCIGHSLALLHEFAGYKLIRLNYVGDWGTQFGKLIYAYLTWGNKKKLDKCPIKHLVDLYVKFNNEAKKDEKLDECARQWFAKLEKNDAKAIELWSKFKHLSLDEFRKIYKFLGVEFDSYNGEAYYAQKVESAIELVEKKKLSETHDGALIVRMKDYEMPMMLRKSDGSTTYASRDLATIIDRCKTINFETLIYVVGHEQALHFKQLFELAGMVGFNKNFVHVASGLYLSPEGGKMSTRAGKTVFMEDVINEAVTLAKKTIEEKNPSLKNKEEVAGMVAVGAIFFGDLMNDCSKDVVFDLQRILSFEGDTGPYLMYTHARAASIVQKAKELKLKPSKTADASLLNEPIEQQVLKLLTNFPEAASHARKQLKPHILAQYLIEFARAFNEFYHSCPCIKEKDVKLATARLTLVEASRQVIENGLHLLGINAPEEM